jgi:hypothetical protein
MVRGKGNPDWLLHDGHMSRNDIPESKTGQKDPPQRSLPRPRSSLSNNRLRLGFPNYRSYDLRDRPHVCPRRRLPESHWHHGAVTAFLGKGHFYIMEMKQIDDTLSERFFVRITFCAVKGEPVGLPRLHQEFSVVPATEEMDWAIHDSAHLPRVAITESTLDHCLGDLLYRQRIGELQMDVSAIVSNYADNKVIADHRDIAFRYLPVTPATKPKPERQLLELIHRRLRN